VNRKWIPFSKIITTRKHSIAVKSQYAAAYEAGIPAFDFVALLFAINLLFVILNSSCSGAQESAPAKKRPNILLLVADDLGYADIGCYGGIISTPHLDSLAASGIRFSRFHTAPMCAPTRAMLLTGTDNHIAGVGRQNLNTDVFGYEGELSSRAIPFPALLREEGYHTYMAGKWHLGLTSAANPHNKGFEHSFVMLEGVGNHYNGKGIFKDGESRYTEDGKTTSWPDGRYSTDLYTDKLISYIDGNKGDSIPFFAMAAYTSPHWPLQADSIYRNKYSGKYDEGYEVHRERNLSRLKEAGLVPGDAVLPPAHDSVRPWDTLSAMEKKKESRKMELYAGMVENLDDNIGRILNYLKEIGEYKNTIIIFISDNGAAGEDYFNEEEIRDYIQPAYDNSIENMGSATSLVSYGAPWAEAGSAPFRYFKEFTSNGGIIAPFIIAGAGVTRKNEIYHGTVTVMDLAPTMLEATSTSYPERWNGNKPYPLEGRSVIPFAGGRQKVVHDHTYAFGMEHSGYTMFRKGDWKINNSSHPFDEARFELYRLTTDLAEKQDLRHEFPEKYAELLHEWQRFIRDKKVQLPR
jgi:arylsulfatase A-like enzyme